MHHLLRLVLVTALAGLAATPPLRGEPAADLPSRLSDAEFRALMEDLSEPQGTFQSDNLVSNESWYQTVLGEVLTRTGGGGVYIGVGPEQNFTYVAAFKPRAAFIIDIRRGNLLLHLMYKALFELSDNRSEFVSRLFGRSVRVRSDASAADLFAALEEHQPTPVRPATTRDRFREIERHLTTGRKLALSRDDLSAIQSILSAFHSFGPSITYGSNKNQYGYPTYESLMIETDGAAPRSFLASEAAFKVVRETHRSNLIIPVVGNLAGSKALRAIGSYVRSQGAKVTVMYISNVEEYLQRDNSWRSFCANVLSLPFDSTSSFIRSAGMPRTSDYRFLGMMSYPGSIEADTRACAPGGHIQWAPW